VWPTFQSRRNGVSEEGLLKEREKAEEKGIGKTVFLTRNSKLPRVTLGYCGSPEVRAPWRCQSARDRLIHGVIDTAREALVVRDDPYSTKGIQKAKGNERGGQQRG